VVDSAVCRPTASHNCHAVPAVSEAALIALVRCFSSKLRLTSQEERQQESSRIRTTLPGGLCTKICQRPNRLPRFPGGSYYPTGTHWTLAHHINTLCLARGETSGCGGAKDNILLQCQVLVKCRRSQIAHFTVGWECILSSAMTEKRHRPQPWQSDGSHCRVSTWF